MDGLSTKEMAAIQKSKVRGHHRRKNRPIAEENNQIPQFEAGSSKSSSSGSSPRKDRKRKTSTELPLPNRAADKGGETGGQTFEEGEDFIPFTLSDPPSSSEIEDRNNRNSGKGSGADRKRGHDWERGIDEARKERDRGWDEDRHRGRDRSDSPRPQDKGKGTADGTASRRQNGKYDMVFDFNDGFANKKQRVDASSRKAPWVEKVDWEECNNVAELYVFYYECVLRFLNFIAGCTGR
jgi:hypothetical protein